MPTVTVEGEKSFEVEAGKKLVLAIEDAGIDIMHRCGGNARCTTCRVQILAGEAPPMEPTEQERLTRDQPRAQYPAILSDPRRIRPVGRRCQPVQPNRNPGRNAAARLRRGSVATPGGCASAATIATRRWFSRPATAAIDSNDGAAKS